MNTRDYGVPQNRQRVYIVGSMDGEYTWPTKCVMNPIMNYVDYTDTKVGPTNFNCAKTTNRVFVDLGFLKWNTFSPEYSPTLAANSSHWNVILKRYSNVKERLMLQGFPTTFKQVVSNTQMKKQIGNSMSVNVLKQIISNNINQIKF